MPTSPTSLEGSADEMGRLSFSVEEGEFFLEALAFMSLLSRLALRSPLAFFSCPGKESLSLFLAQAVKHFLIIRASLLPTTLTTKKQDESVYYITSEIRLECECARFNLQT